MNGLDRMPPGMNEKEIRQWIKEQSHPAVKAAQRYCVSEWIKRILSAVFVGAPAIAFLLLVAIMLIESNSGDESLVIEYDAIQFLMVLSYGIGLMISVVFNANKGWYSPLDEAVYNYLADQDTKRALGVREGES